MVGQAALEAALISAALQVLGRLVKETMVAQKEVVAAAQVLLAEMEIVQAQ
jgi:hypothetical protein